MFETIVWATDGSELADRALTLATDLARTHGSKIVAVHANELLAGRFGGAPLLADEPELRVRIERQLADLRASGFTVELKVETGAGHNVAELIAEAAREVDADLIVVGTHGRSAAASAVLGSVAKGLLHVAPCPVLAVTPVRERVAVG
jgi:nucleotide-binding universal stress UspA family protein